MHVTALGRSEQSGPWDNFKSGDIAGVLPMDLCENIDVVYHLAGIAHAMKLPESQQAIYEQVNINGTTHLLDIIRESEVKSLVYFSSIKAMADPGESCVDEAFQDEPNDPYGLSKRRAEQAVLTFGRQQGFHVCVLRPCLVYGPNPKGNLARMLSAVDRGRFPPLRIRNNRRSMISVADLIEVAIRAGQDTRANGEVFIVSDGEYYSTQRIYQAMCDALNKPVPKWTFPVWPLSILAGVGDIIGAVTRRPFAFNSEALRRITGSACYQNTHVCHKLDWQPAETLESSLPNIIKSMK